MPRKIREKVTKTGKKHSNAVLVLCGIVLAVSTCGLERLVYMFPIDKDRVRTFATPGTGFEFYHNTENNIEEFIGYEIFYKLYFGDGAATAITDDINYFFERFIGTENTITSRGFYSLYRSVLRNRPFVVVANKALSYKYVIDFLDINLPVNSEPVLRIFLPDETTLEDEFFIKRRPQISPEEEKKFLQTEILPGDIDVRSLPGFTGEAGQRLYVALLAAAFGRDDNFSPIYSEAVLLNTGIEDAIEINF